ncbi:uncharacterized protein [Dermacentor andersoni]|uniref:uncharacterized protein n=1 Tax=Dermacentor andersoni TaxID=34620 RepID=UPI003B3A8E29
MSQSGHLCGTWGASWSEEAVAGPGSCEGRYLGDGDGGCLSRRGRYYRHRSSTSGVRTVYAEAPAPTWEDPRKMGLGLRAHSNGVPSCVVSLTTEGGYMAENGTYNLDYEDYDSTEDFLNTTEKIWVYKSTERTNDTCKVDKIEDVYELGAFMTRYHISEGHMNKTYTEATFSYHWADQDTSHPYNEMTVPNEGKLTESINIDLDKKFDPSHAKIDHVLYYFIFLLEVLNLFETLAYQSDDNECGVFYMNFHRDYTDPAAWIELRLKNTSLQMGPDRNCLKAFQDFSQHQISTYNYTPQCQCIFVAEA